MATPFPLTPSVGDEYDGYRWNGTAWVLIGIDLATEYAPVSYTINARTGSYTLTSEDRKKLITINSSSASTLTIPNETVPLAVGTQVTIIQLGTGQVTIAGTGFTPVATPGLKLRTRYSSATVIKLGSLSWIAIGDLTL